MTRIIASTLGILFGSALIVALAGGILAGQFGAELGLVLGGVFGLALAFRYNMDMADVAAARRDLRAIQSLGDRLRRDRSGETSRRVYLRDKHGEIWQRLAARRRERLTGSALSRYTSQRHHDLELSDIGIRRKRKPKR